MIKTAIITVITAITLAACGGGGSGESSPGLTAKPALTLSFYGLPLQGTQATAHAAVMHDTTASAPVASSDASATTVQSLEDALAAKGVTANVTAQVMDGTTLHGIVMGENNGLPPTPDQFGKDPSEWLIVNFQLDDMVTSWSDPSQQAAVTQFANDLSVFVNRAHVSGKQVFVIAPILPCPSNGTDDATYALISAITQAGQTAFYYMVGALPNQDSTPDHMGAGCHTPDSYMQNLRVQAVASDIAARYQANTGIAASDTSAASAPVAASQ